MSANRMTLRTALGVFLRRPSPLFILTALATTVAVRASLGGVGVGDAVVFGAILALWPLQEWVLHVYVLHARPIRLFGRTFDPLAGRSHREHHAAPFDLDQVFIPPMVLLPYFALHVAFWLLAMPSLELGVTGLIGMTFFGLFYEWVHFLVHTNYRPRTRWYKRLWVSHRLHHFKNENYWYGVSMLGADYLLGTHPQQEGVPTSPTCLTLGQEASLGV